MLKFKISVQDLVTPLKLGDTHKKMTYNLILEWAVTLPAPTGPFLEPLLPPHCKLASGDR